MRKIILNLAISLDGFIEGPNGEYDWCFSDQDYGMTEFFKSINAIFMGRKSYELTQSMGDAGVEGFPKFKRYIFSNTLTAVDGHATLVKGDIKIKVEKIKNEPGKDIWLFGGASLVTTFMNEGLVDELMLAIHPILLGNGKPLFRNINERIKLELTDAKTFSSGLVQLFYKVLK